MAMYLICEAIDTETKDFKDLSPDENGMYDLTIQINGKELNVERFLTNLNESYKNAVKRQATDTLISQYDEILHSIYNIQETLQHHEKLFDEKVCK